MQYRRYALVVVMLLTLAITVLSPNKIQTIHAQDCGVFGAVHVGPINDRGWTQNHHEGMLDAANTYGWDYVWAENIVPGFSPITTMDVVTDFVENEGVCLVILTSDAFEEDTNVMAETFPDVTFIAMTADTVYDGSAPSNVGNYNGQFVYSRMMGGYAAGLAAETGQICYLGPLINHETLRHMNSAFLGAQRAWSDRGLNLNDLSFESVFIGFWFNIPGQTLDPTEVANAFYDRGCEVLISGIDTTEGLQVTNLRSTDEDPLYTVMTDSPSACQEAPERALGSMIYNWSSTYRDIVSQVINGSWVSDFVWSPPTPDNPETSPVWFVSCDGMSDEWQEGLDGFVDQIADYLGNPANEGCIMLWDGPLEWQDGTSLSNTDTVPYQAGECIPDILPEGSADNVWYARYPLFGIDRE